MDSKIKYELNSLLETIHLLRSTKNARRILDSIKEYERGRGEMLTLNELKTRFKIQH